MSGLEVYKHKLEVLKKHCEAEKRDPATIVRSVMGGYIVGDSQAVVDRKVQAVIATAPERSRSEVGSGRPPMTALWDKPAQIVEQIKEIEEAGVSRIMLQRRSPPSREDLELVAREILPKV